MNQKADKAKAPPKVGFEIPQPQSPATPEAQVLKLYGPATFDVLTRDQSIVALAVFDYGSPPEPQLIVATTRKLYRVDANGVMRECLLTGERDEPPLPAAVTAEKSDTYER